MTGFARRHAWILRHAWPDFLTAAVFVFIGVALRDRLEDGGIRWLFVPVVLELFLVFALAVMAMLMTVRDVRVLRGIVFAGAAGYLFAAWLFAQQTDAFANAHYAAAWLLVSRFMGGDAPPLSRAHIESVLHIGRFSAMVWGFTFVVGVLLMLVFSVDEGMVDGVQHSRAPAWLWLTIWPGYFIVDGIVRAHLVRGLRATNVHRRR